MKAKSLISVVFLTLLILSSCEKNFNKPDDSFVLNEKEKIILKQGVARLANNKEFRHLVYENVSLRFDGDDNVLLHDVINLYKKDFCKDYTTSTFDTIIQKLNLNGLYPQIYIPYFDSINENDKVYIIEALNVHDSVEFFNSIFIDKKGNIVNTDFLINESFARENEVWVVSLNERVDYNGNMLENSNLKASRIGTKSEYLMKIKCPELRKIESWVKGAPELRLLMKSVRGDISEQFFYPSKRSSIDNKWWTVNGTTGRYLYYWDIETYSKTVHFAWVEVDNFGDQLTINGSFTYKDVNSETGQEFTGNASFSYTIKSWDKTCGSISLHIDDGMMGETYNTGLVMFQDSYK